MIGEGGDLTRDNFAFDLLRVNRGDARIISKKCFQSSL